MALSLLRAAPPLAALLAGALTGAPPRPLEPARVVRASEGYFEEALDLDETGQRLAALRTDGETFAKVEVFDLSDKIPHTLRSLDVPDEDLAVEAIHLLPDARGIVLVSRDGGVPGAGVHASVLDAGGRTTARVGPATAFGRTATELIGFERRRGPHDATAYRLTAYAPATLAPLGKPRVYEADAAGLVRAPGGGSYRILGFYDDYARAMVELPGGRAAVLETLTGKIAAERDVDDPVQWAEAARLRVEHPERSWFAALNQNRSGVDIVDPMGKRHAAGLAIPFDLYDPKSLRDQEGPGPSALWFSLSLDPLNAEAIRRRKPDLPMLDLYHFDRTRGTTRLRARIFVPRPVTWRVRQGRLALCKLRRRPAQGGDELQVYDLR